LNYAAAWGYENRFKLLLRSGADSNVLAFDYVLQGERRTVIEEQMQEGEYAEMYSTGSRASTCRDSHAVMVWEVDVYDASVIFGSWKQT